MAFSLSSREIHLINGHVLFAECKLKDGDVWHKSRIDLNDHLGNDNGKLTTNRKSFPPFNRPVSKENLAYLHGTKLRTFLQCLDQSKRQWSEYNLDDCLQNDNGTLKWGNKEGSVCRRISETQFYDHYPSSEYINAISRLISDQSARAEATKTSTATLLFSGPAVAPATSAVADDINIAACAGIQHAMSNQWICDPRVQNHIPEFLPLSSDFNDTQKSHAKSGATKASPGYSEQDQPDVAATNYTYRGAVTPGAYYILNASSQSALDAERTWENGGRVFCCRLRQTHEAQKWVIEPGQTGYRIKNVLNSLYLYLTEDKVVQHKQWSEFDIRESKTHNEYHIFVPHKPLSLNLLHGIITDGASVCISGNSNQPHHRWILELARPPEGPTTHFASYVILNRHTGTSLDLSASNAAKDEASVKGFRLHQGVNQRWIFERGASGFKIKSAASGNYLGYKSGEKIQGGLMATGNSHEVNFVIQRIDYGFRFSLMPSGFGLDLRGGDARDKTAVAFYPLGGPNLQWQTWDIERMRPQPAPFFLRTALRRQAIGVDSGNSANKTALLINNLHGGASQQWIFEPGIFGYLIKNAESGTYISYGVDENPQDGLKLTANAHAVEFEISHASDSVCSIALVSNKQLHVCSKDMIEGTQLVLSTTLKDRSKSELWFTERTPILPAAFRIQNADDTKDVLDLAGGQVADGTRIITYPSHDGYNQRWIFEIGTLGWKIKCLQSGTYVGFGNGVQPLDGMRVSANAKAMEFTIRAVDPGLYQICLSSDRNLVLDSRGRGNVFLTRFSPNRQRQKWKITKF